MQPLWLAPSTWERGNGGDELILSYPKIGLH